jgi:negative regulator of flagellin synthesis FlgM
MIDGIGKSGAGRVDLQRVGAQQSATGAVAKSAARSPAAGGTVADLVNAGPPVDGDKVSEIRQAIAEGRYAIDPERIAEAMIASDLGR